MASIQKASWTVSTLCDKAFKADILLCDIQSPLISHGFEVPTYAGSSLDSHESCRSFMVPFFGPILKCFEPLFHILAAYLSFFRSKMNDSANIEIFYSDDESDDGESANQVKW